MIFFLFKGNPTYEGHIKVTQQALELFKRGSQPVSWPLKSIRRYGKDAESKCFTFESGRRCPTGPGVYVFRCSRTQQLFERVQSYVRQNSETESVRRSSFGRIIEPDPPISPRNDGTMMNCLPLRFGRFSLVCCKVARNSEFLYTRETWTYRQVFCKQSKQS